MNKDDNKKKGKINDSRLSKLYNVTYVVTCYKPCKVRDFEEGTFDAVYSRDCIIHIREKKNLFERFFKWLKPGGQLLISDYTCCPDEEKTPEFWAYLADRKYDLRPAAEYLKFITGKNSCSDMKLTFFRCWFRSKS